MRTKGQILSLLTTPGIIAIVRTQNSAQVLPVAEALLAGGVIAIEISLQTPNALAALRELRAKLDDRAVLGIGTVMNPAACHAALEAGAEYIITPTCRTDLVPIAHAAEKPIMLGAYTPTEAQTAHEAGADLIKIFPAEGLGPAYIKALRVPLPHLQLVPTGGVNVQNVAEYFKAGCVAAGVSGLLISKQVLQDSNWAELTRRAREFVNSVREARNSLGT
jgi:2-dehydro-3-deoxyphosphogluconate aldolase/(4S)-4-hydroxy-2-oxoglutarate aldolase